MPISIPRCRTTELTDTIIENTLLSILHGVLIERPIAEVVPLDKLIILMHRGTELLQAEPMLLEVEFATGIIVGDLHGSFADLLSVIHEADAPPKKKYLFLGDYVDRGKHQIETFLFVLLMKLRWPKYVYMLRGNHELYDTNASNEFISVCNSAYGTEAAYPLFSRLFDILPVAAIINNDTLCCHGGISQWMTSRDVIREITRPTYLARMKLLENCLLCDILWSDYVSDTSRPFLPSIRGSSYAFNKTAIKDILEALNCKRLIRAHQPFRGGAVENCRNLCYTVHTVPIFKREYHGAYMYTKKARNGTIEYKLRPHNLFLSRKIGTIETYVQSVNRKFLSSFHSEPAHVYDAVGCRVACSLCLIRMPPLNRKARLVSHTELIEWVHENARHIVESHPFFDEGDDDDDYDPRRIGLCFVALFPVAFDIVNLEGSTYRHGLHPDEWEFIRRWHPDMKTNARPLSIISCDAVLDLEPRSITLEREPERGLRVAHAVQKFEDVNITLEAPVITTVEIKDIKKRKAVFAKIRNFFHRRRQLSHRLRRKKIKK